MSDKALEWTTQIGNADWTFRRLKPTVAFVVRPQIPNVFGAAFTAALAQFNGSVDSIDWSSPDALVATIEGRALAAVLIKVIQHGHAFPIEDYARLGRNILLGSVTITRGAASMPISKWEQFDSMVNDEAHLTMGFLAAVLFNFLPTTAAPSTPPASA